MKYIFDFDDVLFETTPKFKERLLNIQNKHQDSYEELMKESPNFINKDILKIIKKNGKENCYLETYGDKDFQEEKITRSGVAGLFSEIFIVQTSKKNVVEKICAQFPDEAVFFIDDKAEHFADLDFQKYPNLKTILYTGQDLGPYLQ